MENGYLVVSCLYKIVSVQLISVMYKVFLDNILIIEHRRSQGVRGLGLPYWNATNDKMWQIRRFFSFSFFSHLRLQQYTRSTVINNNIDDQGTRASPNQFLPANLNLGLYPNEIKIFCRKSCYLRPFSNLFKKLMQ